jgi:hypothetical protein
VQRLKEADGNYDWVTMFRGSQDPFVQLDGAEFVGPVTAAQLPNRGGGRGLVATRDIKTGELLVSNSASCHLCES